MPPFARPALPFEPSARKCPRAMPPAAADEDDAPASALHARWRIARRVALIALLLLVAGLAFVWFDRSRIADTLIQRELARQGVAARYTVEQIGPTRQVLSDIIIGDPAAPDLTIRRLIVRVRPRFGYPEVSGLEVTGARLVGSYRGGELSFGALDPLLFDKEQATPFALPDLALTLTDSRALIRTDNGPVGIAIAGKGHLQSTFRARLAAAAPELALGDCALDGGRFRGDLVIRSERPRLVGPVRFEALRCADAGVALAGGEVALDLAANHAFAEWNGNARLALGALTLAEVRIAALGGHTDFTWREGALTARYALEARDLAASPLRAAALTGEGFLRARDDFARIDIEGELGGSGLAPGSAVDKALGGLVDAGEGTLLAPLAARIRRQLARETRASTFAAEFTARLAGGRQTLLVPRAVWTGASGAPLLSLSRSQYAQAEEGAPLLAGDFSTGGAGLPRIAGRFERAGEGATTLRLAMDDYAAGTESDAARLALPGLAARWTRAGALTFEGRLLADGPLPGGRVRGLDLPLAGSWSERGGLALWPGCTRARFEALRLANLSLDQDSLEACPAAGRPILRQGARGLQLAATLAPLSLSGRLGSTPATIESGSIDLAWPGTLTARTLKVALGPPATASQFMIRDLTADLTATPRGHFAGADIRLAAVPLDLTGASGDWRLADGRLALENGAFLLTDRLPAARFNPLEARDAALALEANRITAAAALREPRSDALVTRVDLAHDLATGTGHADLAIPGVAFDTALQPTDLTPLALGVVALVEGTVSGEGRIDWDEAGVTSTGRFESAGLDFAAAFGPVERASGTVIFTDLIGLTTAPGQRIALAAVNPGIEVYDGEVAFQLTGGRLLDLTSGRWPFLGGTIALRPLTLRLGEAEERGYVFDIEGLEAARFIERMELSNLAATGTLDGSVPILFDKAGNGRIDGGFLLSRPSGGSVAYVGELTYADLSPMAEFAFDTLRALDYRQMRIAMDGPLTGELVTRVALEGVSQGEGTKKNLITRRLAKLPVRMIVNVRAPFYRLISSLRSLYDPTAVRDPRELGLVGPAGEVLRREAADPDLPDPDIQPPESELLP